MTEANTYCHQSFTDQAEPERQRFYLSPTFYFDHVERDLPGGIVVKSTKTYVEVLLSDEELAEMISDAEYYYTESDALDPSLRYLSRAAKRVLDAIEKQRTR